jgi:hypothetical protein
VGGGEGTSWGIAERIELAREHRRRLQSFQGIAYAIAGWGHPEIDRRGLGRRGWWLWWIVLCFFTFLEHEIQ